MAKSHLWEEKSQKYGQEEVRYKKVNRPLAGKQGRALQRGKGVEKSISLLGAFREKRITSQDKD